MHIYIVQLMIYCRIYNSFIINSLLLLSFLNGLFSIIKKNYRFPLHPLMSHCFYDWFRNSQRCTQGTWDLRIIVYIWRYIILISSYQFEDRGQKEVWKNSLSEEQSLNCKMQEVNFIVKYSYRAICNSTLFLILILKKWTIEKLGILYLNCLKIYWSE